MSKEKYALYADLLRKIESTTLYKEKPIEGDLVKQRDQDILKLKELISKELESDGITKIRIHGMLLKRL